MKEPATTANTDEELMTSFASGDHRAFDLLVKRHQDIVWRIARRYTGSNDDALDICQTVFLKLYDAGLRYKVSASFRTYLFRIVSNVCIDHYRKKRHEIENDTHEVADPAPLPDKITENKEISLKLNLALAQLPKRQRTAAVLRYEADLPIKEIAATMGVTEKAVERLLAHAREALRNLMQHFSD